MRVLVFTQYYPPEVGATQNRLHFIASGLAARGHEVTVVAELPNHPSGIIWPEYRRRLWERAREEGVDVVRVWVKTSPRKTFATRMLFYLTYAAHGAVAAQLLAGRGHDVVFASSPPLTVGIPAWLYARARRVPLVLDVRDPWPQVAIDLGEMRNPRAIGLARRLEALLYRNASAVTTVTRGFAADIERAGVPGDRIMLVPNGTVGEVFSPGEPDPEIRRRIVPDGKIAVGYFGNHGIAQDLGTVLDAAARLAAQGDDGLRFVFVGEGPVKADLLERARALRLQNVSFHPEVPVREVPRWIRSVDLTLVPLAPLASFRSFIPSKLFDFMACARPVVLLVDGEAREILDDAGAGWFVPPGNAGALAAALGRAADLAPDERRRIGEAGAAFVRRGWLREQQIARLESALERAISTPRSRPGAAHPVPKA